MAIQVLISYIVSENCIAIVFLFEEKEYVMIVQITEDTFEIKSILHGEEGICPYCSEVEEVEEGTVCLELLLNEKNIEILGQQVQEHLQTEFIKDEYECMSISGKTKKNEAKQYLTYIYQLSALSIERNEIILYFTEDFSQYITKKGLHFYSVDRNGKVISIENPSKNTLISADKVNPYIKGIRQLEQMNVLKNLEIETKQRYDVSFTKPNKLLYLLQAMKDSMGSFEEIYETYTGESFQELIAYLYEILYREIPIYYETQEEFLRKHEIATHVLQQFIHKKITIDDSIYYLVEDFYDYSEQRKDCVIFAIKSMIKADEVCKVFSMNYPEKAAIWYKFFYKDIFSYLQIELGLAFKLDKKEKKELEHYLLKTIKEYTEEKINEMQMYEKIDKKIPFIHYTDIERINQILQEESKNETGNSFYLYKIPSIGDFFESLDKYKENLILKETQFVECDFISLKDKLIEKWIKCPRNVKALKQLLQQKPEHIYCKAWKNISESDDSDEYILCYGTEFFKLYLGRKK